MSRIDRRRPLAAALLVLVVLVGGAPAYAGPTTAVTASERAAALRVSAPRQVESGEKVAFTGKVLTRHRARVVQIAERAGDRWRVVAHARSSRRGAFRVSVPAGSVAGVRIFRAQAPRSGTLALVRTGRLTVKMVAAPVTPPPAGSSDDWSFLMDGGSRWNPCEPITWSYNPVGQAYNALPDVTKAFANIAAASGLNLEYAGASPLVYLGIPSSLVGGADITVGWASASQLSRLVGSVVGVGGAIGSQITGRDVQWELTRGWVTLDNDDPLEPAPGFGASSYGQVMMHEMLHALGLGHATSPTELMAGVASAQNTTFGPGDLAGIARIGAAAGCL
jgi:matrixin